MASGRTLRISNSITIQLRRSEGHDHYQRSEHDPPFEVQDEDRDHQPGAGHPEKRPAHRYFRERDWAALIQE